jgi:glycosyltransferase involved in cell wall biosynthesis
MTAMLNANPARREPARQAGRRGRGRWPGINSLSLVIPALNEEENIPRVMASIPREEIAAAGCHLEVVVVDNGSTDRTSDLAAAHGAIVYLQPARGYGNAYHTGFAVARGDVIATGDADCTYPFDALPGLLDHFVAGRFEFISTNRLRRANRGAMKPTHAIGNRLLTAASRAFFRGPFRDSQSGMWIFQRRIWQHLDVRSGGMQFSQEIKNEAYLKGFHCEEVDIEYRQRGGVVKLKAFRDGTRNLGQLVEHRMRAERHQVVLRRLDGAASAALPAPSPVAVPIADNA